MRPLRTTGPGAGWRLAPADVPRPPAGLQLRMPVDDAADASAAPLSTSRRVRAGGAALSS
jgi:hypothetical protein